MPPPRYTAGRAHGMTVRFRARRRGFPAPRIGKRQPRAAPQRTVERSAAACAPFAARLFRQPGEPCSLRYGHCMSRSCHGDVPKSPARPTGSQDAAGEHRTSRPIPFQVSRDLRIPSEAGGANGRDASSGRLQGGIVMHHRIPIGAAMLAAVLCMTLSDARAFDESQVSQLEGPVAAHRHRHPALRPEQAGRPRPAGAADAGISGDLRGQPGRPGRRRAGQRSDLHVPRARHAAHHEQLRRRRVRHHAATPPTS